MSVEHASSHTRKAHNLRRAKMDGVRLFKRDGQAAYLEYCAPFGVAYLPALEDGLEQVQYRAGGCSRASVTGYARVLRNARELGALAAPHPPQASISHT